MEKKLELVLANAAGDKKTFAVANPRDDVDKKQADEVMQTIIANQTFLVKDAPLAAAVEARIRTTDVTVLE